MRWLAGERNAGHALRTYVWLPLGRVADMWVRPRVENLPIDLDWWVYAHHHVEMRFSWFYAGLNGLFSLSGDCGVVPEASAMAMDAGIHAAAERDAADLGGAGACYTWSAF